MRSYFSSHAAPTPPTYTLSYTTLFRSDRRHSILRQAESTCSTKFMVLGKQSRHDANAGERRRISHTRRGSRFVAAQLGHSIRHRLSVAIKGLALRQVLLH